MQHKILLAAFALFAALTGCQKETPDPEPVILDTPVLTSSDITSSGFKVAWGVLSTLPPMPTPFQQQTAKSHRTRTMLKLL